MLGFQYEHSRKDRDDYLKVSVVLKELEVRYDFNFSIFMFTQELTRLDPFSVILLDEGLGLDKSKILRCGMMLWNYTPPDSGCII